jgi:protein phosphatase
MTRFAWGLASDVGRLRAANQDSALAVEGLFAVADGMGGHRGGEVASDVAITALGAQAPVLTSADLLQAIHAANEAIVVRSADDPALRGMGTTLCVLALVEADGEPRLAIANVGDSRVYLFAHGELEQMTDDHSLVAALVREGRLTPEEAESHPQRNILTRALGIEVEVLVDAWEVIPFTGDRWVLCSDGLFNEVSEDQIAAVLRRLADPREAADELVRLANEGGGRDNITVLVVDIIDDPDHARIAPSAATAARDATDIAGFTSAAVDQDPLPSPEPPAPSAPAPTRRRTRRVTWRTVAFFGALLGVLAVAVGAVAYYARNSWYVDLDDDTTAVIYQGRAGGVLWFEPTEVTRTSIARPTDAQRAELTRRTQLGSRAEAEDLLARLVGTTTTTAPVVPSTTAPTTTFAPTAVPTTALPSTAIPATTLAPAATRTP